MPPACIFRRVLVTARVEEQQLPPDLRTRLVFVAPGYLLNEMGLLFVVTALAV